MKSGILSDSEIIYSVTIVSTVVREMKQDLPLTGNFHKIGGIEPTKVLFVCSIYVFCFL